MYKASTDAQFERSFADLAFSVLRDKVPRLVAYLVGFQVIDKDEDETKAIGVFGFKYDKSWFYAPVFFINGELKGSELLYVKAMKSFVPLQENWINYILSKKTYTEGEGEQDSDEVRRHVMPDFSPYRTSPLAFGKYGSFKRTGYWCNGSWFDVDDFMQCFGVSPSLEKYSTAVEQLSLPNVLHDLGLPAVEKVASMVRHSKTFASALRTFYPEPNDLLFKFALDKQAALSLPKKETVQSKASGCLQFIKEAALDGDKAFDTLSDAERKKLLEDGVSIRDSRTEKTRVFSATVTKSAQNPETTGIYRVLGRGGDMFEAIVGVHPMTIGEGSSTYTTVIRKSDNAVLSCRRNDVYVTENKNGNISEGGIAAGSMEVGQKYVLTDGSRLTITVEIVAKTEENGIVTFYADECYCRRFFSGNDRFSVTSRPACTFSHPTVFVPVTKEDRPQYAKDDDGYGVYGRPIVVNEKLTGLHNIGNTLFCGSGVKALKVKKDSTIQLGSLPDFEAAMYKIGGLDKVTVYHHAGRYQLRSLRDGLSNPMSGVEFLTSTMAKYGTAEPDTRSIMKSAQASGAETFFFKYAAGMSPSVAAEADIASSYDGTWGSQVSPYVNSTQALPALQSTHNRDAYNPDPKLDRRTMNMAGEAARTGQKEVFDASVITSLVKTIDVGSMTDKYLANLMLGLDRVGRILFMYYWHHDKFVSRYGQEEMSELEDSLKNTFKSIGDVVLFLKKKMADPDQLSAGTDVKLDQVADE